MPLTSEQQALRKLAEAASPGRWMRSPHHFIDSGEDRIAAIFPGFANENANYIAAANPSAILALLDQIEALTAEHAHAIDSIAQLQDEVLALQAKLAGLASPAVQLEQERQPAGTRACIHCEGRGVIYQCVVCCASEPRTGACSGPHDPRALCAFCPAHAEPASQRDAPALAAAARAVLESKWDADGDCRSCGWHAALYEHEVDDSDILDALQNRNGILELSCVSKDADDPTSHRGIKIDIKPVGHPTPAENLALDQPTSKLEGKV